MKIISTRLADSGFELTDEGLRLSWAPDDEHKEKCREYGRKFARNA